MKYNEKVTDKYSDETALKAYKLQQQGEGGSTISIYLSVPYQHVASLVRKGEFMVVNKAFENNN